ncbi:MAG: hypothetical protein N4A54_03610 [Peptostreptococcaceae bacterium]|nr:hypothetical protein [Peptostreptococcaceae bacterium]
MKEVIPYVFFRPNENEEYLMKITDMNKSSYQNVYKGKLFCPHKGCNANIGVVKKNETLHFRTWKSGKNKKKEHIFGCPFDVRYNEIQNGKNSKKNNYEQVILSDRHIQNTLKNAYENIIRPKEIKDKNLKKQQNSKSFENEESKVKNILRGDAFQNLVQKEQNIYSRFINQIDETDINQIRCIIGDVSSMFLGDSYAYINLLGKTADFKIISIYFSEKFKATNKNQFQKFNVIKKYIENNDRIICCCIGRIFKNKNTYSYGIYVDRYNAFLLNGHGFYDILFSINDM